ncbi:MAG: hypothetical protein HOG49_14325 [Candidatus Scalindua sp.]|jgi:hypothetical protein|nr:hypothetical protein [Candidatus Scalindua sp.]
MSNDQTVGRITQLADKPALEQIEQEIKDYGKTDPKIYENTIPQPLAGFVKISFCRECGFTGPEEIIGCVCENCADDKLIQAVHRGDGQGF